MKNKILVIDDDPQLRQSFVKLLIQEGFQVSGTVSGEDGLLMINEDMPDLVITDVRLPGMNGLETFRAIRKLDSRLPVIVMTAFGTTEMAIEATKLGAYDYVLKPFDIPDMLKLIKQAIEAGRLMRSQLKMGDDPETPDEAIIGRSSTMQEVYKAIGRAAPTDATVLIRGESGTGKELMARAIYQHSLRVGKPFLVINCVAIPETLLESELFGYEKGAFTGAAHRRVGKFEQASGGTLFLDEIGDMPLSIQAKILRMLQERSIERLGGRETIEVDVRILAATNRNLETAIEEGRFRQDLYYRLNVVSLNLPPLRERQGDVPLLGEYFLNRFALNMNIPNPGVTQDAKALLSSHTWPGNVRELANCMEKCLIFARGRPLTREDVAAQIFGGVYKPGHIPSAPDEAIRKWARQALAAGGDNMLTELTDHVVALIISEALNIAGGNRTRTAELLGLSRPTLLAKMDKHKIKTQTSVKSD